VGERPLQAIPPSSPTSPPDTGDDPGAADHRRRWLLLGIILIAINLRPALAGVGPVIADIRADTGLSHAALGLLTSIPLLAFGAVSAFSGYATRLFGFGGALAMALLLLAAGAGVRAIPSVPLLFAGTVALGVGIAVGNVLLPALVKRSYPHRSGSMTSLYSSVMALGATVAAGVTVPVSQRIGWPGALGMWALPALVALVAWLPQVDRRERSVGGPALPATSLRDLMGSPLAWQIALFMGLQSLTFYVVLAWLPDLLQSRGLTAADAGWMLAVSQATGIAGSATVPVLAARGSDQRSIVGVLALLEALSLGGLLLDVDAALTIVWVGTLGLVLGGTFGLALLFLVLRASDTAATTQLSGMAQSIGYLIAATGPVVFGLLYDLTSQWTVPLLFLFAVLAGKLTAGVAAGRPGHVGPRRTETPDREAPAH
jgi:MFS transporter, CP family, cyanate transporter